MAIKMDRERQHYLFSVSISVFFCFYGMAEREQTNFDSSIWNFRQRWMSQHTVNVNELLLFFITPKGSTTITNTAYNQ